MGFLDKLFAKKICDICGGEIGLLGNKKLEDGNCCKNCAKKLSVWFDERRHSTIEQIKSQLAYREQNAKELEGFSADVVLGEYQKMYVQLNNGVPYRFVVSSSNDFKAENADIILFKNVSSCDLKIRDSRTEIKYTNDKNERVSYNPPRYEYHYDFYINLEIANTPWFDDISLRINRSTLKLETVSSKGVFIKAFDPALYPEYRELKGMCDDICSYVSCGQRGEAISSAKPADGGDADFMDRLAAAESDAIRIQMLRAEAARCTDPAKRQEYLDMAVFYGKNQEPKAEKPVGNPPAATQPSAEKWICQACQKENSGKFCSGCGAAKPVPASASGWKCFCGTVNTAKFCQNCGIQKFAPEDIECSECSWTADTWHEEVGVPSNCPNCGKEFNSDDIS